MGGVHDRCIEADGEKKLVRQGPPFAPITPWVRVPRLLEFTPFVRSRRHSPKFRQRTLVAAHALSSPAASPEERLEEKTEEKQIISL
jgi:hypothetical protein